MAHDFGNWRFREGSASCLQDNRAVGNSRLVHRDVLNVSCKQLADPSPRHGLNSEQSTLLQIYLATGCVAEN